MIQLSSSYQRQNISRYTSKFKVELRIKHMSEVKGGSD
jgi:hypothetical protein